MSSMGPGETERWTTERWAEDKIARLTAERDEATRRFTEVARKYANEVSDGASARWERNELRAANAALRAALERLEAAAEAAANVRSAGWFDALTAALLQARAALSRLGTGEAREEQG